MDILNKVLIEGSILTLLVAALGFILRTYLTKRIDYRIEEKLEERKMELEIKKEFEVNKLRNVIAIYPSILEATYRLRNGIRSIAEHANSNGKELEKLEPLVSILKEDLKIMEELIITSKAFIDKETHSNFHDYKNFISSIIYKSKSYIEGLRTKNLNESDFIEFKNDMKSKSAESEAYFNRITRNVKTKLDTN